MLETNLILKLNKMKDTKTHRSVKNVLHNELGITPEKVERLISDYIDKKFNKRVDDFMNSRTFEYMVEKRIKEAINPIVREALKDKLRWVNISVQFDSDNQKAS